MSQQTERRSAPTSPGLRGPLAVIATAIPVHVALALWTDLTPDEAYYLASARSVRIPDHPPLLPWILAASDRALSLPVELRIRTPAILTSALLTVGVVLLVHQIERHETAGERAGSSATLLAAVLATWLPIPMAGGFLATPDTLALLGVVAAISWAASDAPSHVRSALTAVVVALGALAKVVVVPIALLAAALALRPGTAVGPARHRPWQRLAWLLPLALISPWLIASLRFQIPHAFGTGDAWSVPRVAGALLATLLASFVLWCPPVVLAGVPRLGRLPAIYPATFGLVTLLLLGSTLARAAAPEPNWWAPAALPVLVAGSIALAAASARARRSCMALAVLPTVVALTHVLRPWLPIAPSLDPTARLHGWQTDAPPLSAAGVGAYAAPAERCAYHAECEEISRYINHLTAGISSRTSPAKNR